MSFSRKLIAGAAVAGLLSTVGIVPAEARPKNQARAVAQPDWLEQNIDNPKVRIIEVSTEPGIYERENVNYQIINGC